MAAIQRKADEARQQQQEHVERCLSWFRGWTARVEREITAGGVSADARLPNMMNDWPAMISNSGHKDHWLWQEHMVPWATQEGLVLEVVEEHDGMGWESWCNIKVLLP